MGIISEEVGGSATGEDGRKNKYYVTPNNYTRQNQRYYTVTMYCNYEKQVFAISLPTSQAMLVLLVIRVLALQIIRIRRE